MNIVDFLPKYPFIEPSKYSLLNPYEGESFNETIFRKKEFYENRLEKAEPFPKESGMLMKHQKTIARYMSSNTPYDRLLLVHSMGTGKCVAPNTNIYVNNNIQTIENVWNSYHSDLIIQEHGGYWSMPSIPLHINSYDENTGKIVQAPIKMLYRQNVSEKMRKINLRNGYHICCTKAHKFLTQKGWTTELDSSSYVAIPKKIIKGDSTNIDKTIISLLAWQIGGGKEENPLTIENKDCNLLKNVVKHLTELKNHYDLKIDYSINSCRNKSYKLTIEGDDYKWFMTRQGYYYGTKIIPDLIMNAPIEQISLFLKNFLQSCSIETQNKIELSFTQTKPRNQIQHLLKLFSISSLKKTRLQQNGRKLYLLQLEDQEKLYKYLSFDTNVNIHQETEIYPVSDILKEIHLRFNIPKYKLGTTIYVDGQQYPNKQTLNKIIFNLKQLLYSDLDSYIHTLEFIRDREFIFIKVQSIEEYEYSGWVYDFEIEKYHNYVANCIITHNTCSAIGAIEQIRQEQSNFIGALILAKGTPILDNFMKELVEKCTAGQYIPENYSKLTELEKIHRIKKKIRFYELRTFMKFTKMIRKMSNADIIENYSNKIIVIDEVHNLRIQEGEKLDQDTYDQMYRFLHLIRNAKVLLLSGTPMKDSPEEISAVSNLILSEEKKLPTGDEFLEEYFDENNNKYIMKEEKKEEFKNLLRGRVSFLREAYSTVKKEYLGESNFGRLEHFIVKPNKMSDFQSEHYLEAVKNDGTGKKGVYINSREASLFVYPDGSYGKKGFTNYIEIEKSKKTFVDEKEVKVTYYRLASDLREKLEGKTDEETLKNIYRHSATYGEVIENILNTKGNCFVYSSLAQGSGAILFSLLLSLFGYKRANGKEKEPGKRYAILTNLTATTTEIRRIVERFNRKDNIRGEYIQVIIGSRAISEGFSFRNVIFEAINTPHWNYSETAQALARGIRLGSHNDLLERGINPVVKIIQPVSMPKEGMSIDLLMYETSEDKDVSIRGVLRLLMETSFDCGLNYLRNYVKGKNGSRECDYTVCKYDCDDVNMNIIKQGLEEEELDYSTYELYYANPKIPLVRKRIENLFRLNHNMSLDSIINNLKSEFTEEEIKNSLYIIEEQTESTDFDYKTYLEIYSRNSVKIISNRIEEMFKENFRLDISFIYENLQEFTKYEILTALRNLINESVVIKNKYGLPCYLREQNNIYFLVNNLSITPTIFSDYYSQYPCIKNGNTFEDVVKIIYNSTLPSIINSICSTKDEKEFNSLISNLPKYIQELMIESAIIAKEQKIKSSAELQNKIMEFFKSYIKEINEVFIVTLSEKMRCKKAGSKTWEDCRDDDIELLQQYEANKREEMKKNNPYGIMGLYNPINGAFCIVDFKKEESDIKKMGEKRTKSAEDKRLTHSGKVCGTGGWKLPELMYIAIKRLGIDVPEDAFSQYSREKAIETIKGESKLKELFTDKELKKADMNLLRKALYWGLPKTQGGNRGIKQICEGLKEWFKNNGLLHIDDKCGVQGKKKTVKTEKAQRIFKIVDLVANKSPNFKDYVKDISKLMGECFQVKKYKPEIDNKHWILVLSKSKLVGFLTIDESNIIWNVCVATNYRRQGVAREAIRQAIGMICMKGDKPRLLVDMQNKNVKKLLKMYSDFGFKETKVDDKYTVMEYSCQE